MEPKAVASIVYYCVYTLWYNVVGTKVDINYYREGPLSKSAQIAKFPKISVTSIAAYHKFKSD